MNQFFDEDSQKLLINAKNEMLELKHPYVGSEHLLLAILKCTSLEITKKLNEYHIFYDEFRNKLIESVGVGSKGNHWFLLTPMLKKIIINAGLNSKNNITPQDLLFSLFQVGDGVANRVMLSMKIDMDDLYQFFIHSDLFSFHNAHHLLIEDFAINMNKIVCDPIIEREKQISQIIMILLRKNKNNPLLIGDPGVGKTAIVEELSRLISTGNVPPKLKNVVIYNLQISRLVAGTKYRGEFEEKFHRIIDEIKNNPNIILFIDEFHTIIGAGGAEGAIDASNIIKPYLSRGELRVIGATTKVEYHKWIEKDQAFDRRFQKLYIEEATESDMQKILLKLRPIYEKYHNVVIPDDILNKILSYSSYISFGHQPDKSIDLLDATCALCSSKSNAFYKFDNFVKRKNKIIKDKNQLILERRFEEALSYKKKEIQLEKDYHKELLSSNRDTLVVDEKTLEEMIYLKSNIPVGTYLNDRLNKVYINMKKIFFGENEMIRSICNFILSSNYFKKNNPLCFLFVGKSGMGKTFFVHEFSKLLVGEDSIYTFYLQDYLNKSLFFHKFGCNIDTCCYNIGHYLLHSILNRPFSILIFDNIQYADSNLLNFIFKTIDDGYYIDSFGEKINISKCIFLFVFDIELSLTGFSNDSSSEYIDYFQEKVDSVFYFHNISKKNVIDFLIHYCKDSNISLETVHSFVSEYALNHAINGYGDVLSEFKKKFSLQ